MTVGSSSATEQGPGAGAVVRIGLLGYGNVGSAFAQLVGDQAEAIAARTGLDLRIAAVAVRDVAAAVERGLDPGLATTDAAGVVGDPTIDLVVELIGGVDPARQLVHAALAAGKPVVTGNKELIAGAGAELFAAADASGRDLLFEAAVAGGIPLVRALRESLRGEPITRVMGIVNGTTNFILTKMTEEGADYADALATAQSLGFAERDPTADVEGHDAAAKTAIIATIAFGAHVVAKDVYVEGISRISAPVIAVAERLGYVVKLLGIAEQDRATGAIGVRVHPTMVPVTHPLAAVRDSYNAIFIEGVAVGSMMLYGRGAGGSPTASAVLGDVIDAALNLSSGAHGPLGTFAPAQLRPIDEISTEYLLGLDVADRPGVLHAVTGVFARHGVSIRTAEQEGNGPDAQLVFITHVAQESAIQATVAELEALDEVLSVDTLLRLIGEC